MSATGQGAARWGATIGAAGGLVWLGALFAPEVALEPRLAYALAFAVVACSLVGAAYFVPALAPRYTRWGGLLALLTLFALRSATISGGSAALLTVALLTLTTLLGASIGGRIEQPGHLLAVAAISSLADLWSVYDPSGPSAKLAAQAAEHSDRLVLFALPWAMLGTSSIEAIIGAGDILFAALYLATLSRHGLAATKAAWAMLAGLLIGLGCLLMLERSVPLLPFLGAAVLAAEPRARSLSGTEGRSVAIVVVVLAAVLAYRFAR